MSKPKSIRIESDGSPGGTNVFDVVTGAKLRGIRHISIEIGLDGCPLAKIEFVCPEIKGKGEVVDITGLGDFYRRYVKDEPTES